MRPTMSDTESTPPAPALACLGGQPAPPEMAMDLRLIADLPEAGQRRLWEALGPSLMEPIPPAVEQRLTDFCRRFEIEDAILARALKAARHLVRSAAAADLDRDRLAEDVATLAGEAAAPRIQAVLLAGYDAARTLIRAEIARRTLADHDDLVTRVDHRVEQIVSSCHGKNLGLRLLALTFRTRRGEREERVTVRLAPEQVDELRRACEAASKA
jgi:hypothetical protein